jgi:tetratricopeptide (TPR) repeat protein
MRLIGRVGSRRVTACVVLTAALCQGACARRVPPAAVATPHYPDFVFPGVPPDLGDGALVRQQDDGWRWLQSGDLRQAEREFTSALKRSAAFFPADAAMGYVELARERFDDAAARFDRALQRRDTYAPALAGRGQALLALKREPEALATFEAAVRADPALVDVRRRVEVLRLRVAQETVADARRAADAGRYDEAVHAYERAIAASPESAFLYRDLAAIERTSGRADLALAHLTRAVDLDPADAASLVNTGEILAAGGDLDAALAAYERAATVAPDEATAKRISDVRAKLEFASLPSEYQAIGQSAALTRGELAALIGVRLASLLRAVQGQTAVVITDTRGHWASKWIMAVAGVGVMAPYPNHAFDPSGVVRRGDLAQAVSRIVGTIAAAQPARLAAWREARPAMADVSTGNLSYADAALAVAAGVMPLLDGGAFQLSRPVSGAEAIEVIDRLETLARGVPGADSRSR